MVDIGLECVPREAGRGRGQDGLLGSNEPRMRFIRFYLSYAGFAFAFYGSNATTATTQLELPSAPFIL